LGSFSTPPTKEEKRKEATLPPKKRGGEEGEERKKDWSNPTSGLLGHGEKGKEGDPRSFPNGRKEKKEKKNRRDLLKPAGKGGR